MQRLLITGGTGYLGGELVRQARAAGWHIAATYLNTHPPVDTDVTWLAMDVRQEQSVQDVFAAFRPALVIHTAFRQYEPDLWSITAEGARYVARSAYAAGARLIHMSSDVIFDGEHGAPYAEDAPPNPITDYGAAKAAAESFVAAEHLQAAIVRTSLIYGFEPMDRQTAFVLSMIDDARDTALFSDEYRCPIFVVDLAAALLELAASPYQGIINIAGPERLSRYEFGVSLARSYDRDPTRLKSGLSHNSSVRRPRDCTLDISLAQRTLQTTLHATSEVLARNT